MLIPIRNQNESILIHTTDGIIEVSVNQVVGGQVKLGIEAPQSVQIEVSEQGQSDWRHAPIKSPSFFSSLSFSKF